MRIDKGKLILSDVFFQKDWLVLRHGSKMANARSHLVWIQMQALGDQIRVGIEVTGGIAQQQGRKRGIVLYDDPPFAVQNLAAGCKDRHIADAVLFGSRGVIPALHHLQLPQSVGQQKKDRQNQVLRRCEADFRNFVVTAEHQFSVLSSQLSSDPLRGSWLLNLYKGCHSILALRDSAAGGRRVT